MQKPANQEALKPEPAQTEPVKPEPVKVEGNRYKVEEWITESGTAEALADEEPPGEEELQSAINRYQQRNDQLSIDGQRLDRYQRERRNNNDSSAPSWMFWTKWGTRSRRKRT